MDLLLADVRWSQGVEDAWSRTATFVPKFLGFLLIVVVGFAVARAMAVAVDRILERTGFTRAVERGGIRRALASSRYDASDLVSRLVFYGLMLFVLQLAFGVFGANPVSDLIAGVVAFLPKLLAAVIIVVVASAIAAAVRDIVGSVLAGLSYGRTLATIASTSIVVLGVFMALDQVDVAPRIVNALFYGLVAVLAGSAIVAIGGGGIQPMRARWERALSRWDAEAPKVRAELRAGRQRRELDLRERAAAVAGADTNAPAGRDDTTLVPSGAPSSTQERIRAEIRSEADTLP